MARAANISFIFLISLLISACGAGVGSLSAEVTTSENPTTKIVVETTIESAPEPIANATNAQFLFSSNFPNVSFEVNLDNLGFQTSSDLFEALDLSEGKHTLEVRAVNADGLIDTSPALYEWHVSIDAPVAEIVFPQHFGTTYQPIITVRGTASDLSGIASVKVNGIEASTSDEYANWTASVPLSRGENRLSLSVTEKAGLTVQHTTNYIVDHQPDLVAAMQYIAAKKDMTRVFTADVVRSSIFEFDYNTKSMKLASGPEKGTGRSLGTIQALLFDDITKQVVVAHDGLPFRLTKIDLNTGNRTALTSDTNNYLNHQNAGGLTITPDGKTIYTSSSQKIYSFNVSTNTFELVLNAADHGLQFMRDIKYSSTDHSLYITDSNGSTLARYNLTDGLLNVISRTKGTYVGQGPSFLSLGALALDLSNNRIFATSAEAIFSISTTTGDRTIISNSKTTNGRALIGSGIDLDSSFGTMHYLDGSLFKVYETSDSLIKIAALGGNRELLFQSTMSGNTSMQAVEGFEVTSDVENAYVLSRKGLHHIDLTNGSQSNIKQWSNTSYDLALNEANQSFYRLDINLQGVIEEQLDSTLDRIVTGFDTKNNLTYGAGALGSTDYISKNDITNEALVGGSSTLHRVNLTDGSKTTINTTSATLPDIQVIRGITWINSNQAALLDIFNRMYNVNLETGERSKINISGLSSINSITKKSFRQTVDTITDDAVYIAGSGKDLISRCMLTENVCNSLVSGIEEGKMRMGYPTAIQYSPANNTLFWLDSNWQALVEIDISTGERLILSK